MYKAVKLDPTDVLNNQLLIESNIIFNLVMFITATHMFIIETLLEPGYLRVDWTIPIQV